MDGWMDLFKYLKIRNLCQIHTRNQVIPKRGFNNSTTKISSENIIRCFVEMQQFFEEIWKDTSNKSNAERNKS